ncbi:MAG: hypothetical protein LAT61_14415 [Alcanivorax sp.]|nr:hypothetical protein [Alcanivorax sp.]
MKQLSDLAKGLLLGLAVILSPTSLYAHDTEIFFSRAQADNEQNQAIANVMIMLDTSGSMRWCQNELGGGSGHNATWCTDYEKRRINILQNALRDMLMDTPDGVRIGIGRFNYNVPNPSSNSGGVGQIGGRILVPVTEVNDGTRQIFLDQIDTLNDAGNNASAPLAGAQPVGDTPTGRAYAEAARYMMGMAPVYGTPANGAVTSVCLETAIRDVGCRQVFDGWTEFVEIEGECDVMDPSCRLDLGDEKLISGVCDTSQESCRVEIGEFLPISGTCDVSLETCELRPDEDWGPATTTPCDISLPTCRDAGWTAPVITRQSGATNQNCTAQSTDRIRYERICNNNNLFCLFGSYRCERSDRLFQTRGQTYFQASAKYYEREEVYFQREATYREECDQEEYCANEADIIKDGRYVSPMNMENQCESNHVILFTDGAPSPNDTPGNQGFLNCGSSSSYVCQRAISNYLFSESNAKGREVKTYNIGLYMGGNEVNMRQVSTDGAEGTINADDGEELIRAFSRIIDLVADNARSFSSPGVAVNQMNRLEHLDQLYYAVFEPRESSYWDGNLKRYRLADELIRDATGSPAVNPDTAFFYENSRSFWSSEADGPDVRAGGAREHVGERRLFYTNAEGNMRQVDWANDNNPVMFGLPENAEADRIELLKNRLRTMWGDPLHSEPVLVNYGGSNQNNVIFVSGNGGMLHAIDSRDGKELFAFMPHQFFRQANRFTVDRPGLAQDNRRQLYGLDGSWTAWRRPGATASSAPSAVYLYGGMRRGGYSYYALNVSNRNNPARMWQINRGDAGFARLGQTWSQPTLTQVMINGAKRPVLVFGGGYSPEDHDLKQGSARSAGQDQMGNMIYVVDALNGSLLWSAGSTGAGANHTSVPGMNWAVPSGISVVDVDFDGVADHLYFGDMGGQVWRVDIDQENVSDSQVHKLADLSGNGRRNNRRFYYPPAVGYVKNDDDIESLYVTLGSGYRAHPLDESVDDYFFSINDKTALMGVAPQAVNFNQLTTLVGGTTVDGTGPGWKLELVDDGEKATASPAIFSDHIFFTSYQPGGDQLAENPCAVRMGTSFLYVVNLVTGAAGTFPGVEVDATTRRRQLQQDGLAPTPSWLSDDENLNLIIGTELVGAGSIGAKGMRRGSWYQLSPGEPDIIKPNE